MASDCDWIFFVWLLFFSLVPSSGFLKPFNATIRKGIQACVHFLGCSLGFEYLEVLYYFLEDLVNSKNSFLIFLQKLLVTMNGLSVSFAYIT